MGRPNLGLRREVGKIFDSGQFYRGPYLHIGAVNSNLNRILISIRKKFGNAVRRNRIKRQIRMLCMEIKPTGNPNLLILISIREYAPNVSYMNLRKDLLEAFRLFRRLEP